MSIENQRRLTGRERRQIYRCVGGLRLPCGCVAGRYLTYSGDQITVIDHAGQRCDGGTHAVDTVVAEMPGDAP